jgi:methionine synthase I (cobalamin-dependent)
VSDFAEALRSRTLLLDAAVGTALIDRGLNGRAPEWNLTHPDEVLAVHRGHVEGGAEVVLTNTFVGASAEEAAASLRLARESGAEFVAGSLWAGLPDLQRQIAQLAAADAIWLESATSAAQALNAVQAARRATALPVVLTCAMERAPLEELTRMGAAVAGYNCTPWPTDAAGAEVLKPDAAGLAPEAWARRVMTRGAGARILGGCCGTTAEHLRALQRLRATPR